MPRKPVEKSKSSLLEKVNKAVEAVKKRNKLEPEAGIVLGTGLGNLVKKMEIQAEIEYEMIPHFPVASVESHSGKLVLGHLSGKATVAMEGRFHFYEGYSMDEVTFPIRVLKGLGAKDLIVSNAAGGLNLGYGKGDIVILNDHINFMWANPLIGPNDERLGPRFPDMSAPYSRRLISLTERAAKEEGLAVRKGVYIGVAGPNLETCAEYRMMRAFGADLVGMSTIPEVLVGVHMGMEILGLSVVTDMCDPDHLHAVDIKEIIKTANEAGPKLDRLIAAAVRKF